MFRNVSIVYLTILQQSGNKEPGEVLLEHGRDVEVEQLAQDGLQVGVGGVHGLGKPGITRFVFSLLPRQSLHGTPTLGLL